MPRITGLHSLLLSADIPTRTIDGWETRGKTTLTPRGLVVHHDVSNPTAASEAALRRIITNGRSDLPGPLYNVWVDRAGFAWIVGAGTANHAGSGGWRGVHGNSNMFGLCLANNGVGEAHTPAQLSTAYKVTAVVAETFSFDEQMVCGHKEWTTRKPDPFSIDMNDFRNHVRRQMNDNANLNDKDMADLKAMLAHMRKVGSNPSWVEHVILDLRARRRK